MTAAATDTAPSRERRQQHIEELCAAAIRALAGQGDLHFRGGRLHRGTQRLPAFAPHLHPSLEHDDFASFRGAADGLALRLAHSDAALHQQLRPADDETARMLFELMEQLRVESQVPAHLAGVRRNLAHRFEAWSLAYHHSGLTDTERGLWLYAAVQMVYSRVLGAGAVEATEDLIETPRGHLTALIGHELYALRHARGDQAAYGRVACALAEKLAGLLRTLASPTDQQIETAEAPSVAGSFNLWLDFDEEVEQHAPSATTERSNALHEAGGAYRVFTTAYDRELRVDTLVRPALLREYRERLDRAIADSGINPARLARQLQALLAEPAHDGWDGAQEEGRIDGARLAQLISTPSERRLFRADRTAPAAHTALSFLLDCSGSMKQHIEAVALLVDVMARALERAGVASEILGFTTGAWDGGRAQRDWQRAGQPRHPGRLNERCHLVFKDAETPWGRARPAIAGLFKADLFREGIDGEAVDWACERLLARPEPRRILIVLSDGCPMDGATARANDPTYLDQHLLDVVQRREAQGAVEVCALGVGLDLSVFYDRSQALDLTQGFGPAVLRDVLELLAGRHRR